VVTRRDPARPSHALSGIHADEFGEMSDAIAFQEAEETLIDGSGQERRMRTTKTAV
jgi:hypothetical protein